MLLLLCVAMTSIVADLRAQVTRKVDVLVTTVSGTSVFVDQGRDAKIEPGDTLTLLIPGVGPVHLTIKAVSRTNSRAESLSPLNQLTRGTRGEVQVPEERFKSTPTTNKTVKSTAPDHPPWTGTVTQDTSKPLLAPMAGRKPEERPTKLRGRLWLNSMNSWNRGLVDHRYLFASVGTELHVENPFEGGGELHLRGEMTQRNSYFDFAEDEATTRGRIDRLSYRYGHSSDGPVRFQAGRFLQTMFPEFGLLDGVEADAEISESQRVGVSLGGFPEPFFNQSTGEDVQTAAFWRYSSGDFRSFDLGVGYQKTWHKGAPDRDLIVVNTYARPTDDFSIYSSVWVDYYTSGDTIKGSGLEVTEVLFNGSYRLTPNNGMGLSFSNIRWPELKRDEFSPLSAATILDNRVTRLTANSWHQITDHFRLNLRLTGWEDQTRDGADGSVECSLRDLLWDRGNVSVTFFQNDGAFNDGRGARLSAYWYGNTMSLHGSYEIALYEDDLPAVGADNHKEFHALNGGLQWMATASTDLSFNADYRFGEGQNALTLALYVQTRF